MLAWSLSTVLFFSPCPYKDAGPTLGPALTQDQFLAVVRKVERAYAPVVAQAGGRLTMLPSWSDSYDRAAAERRGQFWLVRVWAGAVGQNFDSEDGLALTLCHELGHHLGGPPRYVGSWSSVEGQADYYATAECLRRVFSMDDNRAAVEGLAVDPEVLEACEVRHPQPERAAICARSAWAGLNAAHYYHRSRGGSGGQPAFSTPSPSRAMFTQEQNRDPQCRLDTFFQGALANPRPACWYVER